MRPSRTSRAGGVGPAGAAATAAAAALAVVTAGCATNVRRAGAPPPDVAPARLHLAALDDAAFTPTELVAVMLVEDGTATVEDMLGRIEALIEQGRRLQETLEKSLGPRRPDAYHDPAAGDGGAVDPGVLRAVDARGD